MAAQQPRNPSSQQWTYVSPSAATQPNAPGYPKPGLADNPDVGGPMAPVLNFTPPSSPCQQGGNQTAVGGNPGLAGPVATVPTTQMQDFGQPMGQTLTTPTLPSTAQGGSP